MIRRTLPILLAAVVAWAGCLVIVRAQEPPADGARPLAPGVLTTIPPAPENAETFTGPLPLVELTVGHPELKWTPNFDPESRTIFERAQKVILRRGIWNLEFSFKPLRMVEVDVPQPTGKMQRKLIWYMAYRLRYIGTERTPDPVIDRYKHKKFSIAEQDRQTRYFFPLFILESHEYQKSYLDRIVPAAKKVIQDRERPGKPIYNSVEISAQPLRLSTADDEQGVWGFVTWEDVDPRIDYFSIYIRGLTNAYKPVDVPGAFKQGDPPGTGRDLLLKTLRLNFWRPGDTVREHENEIRFGVPVDSDPARQSEILGAFGLRERLDYEWLYR